MRHSYNATMGMLLELPPLDRTLVLDPPLSDAELEEICLSNDSVQVERTREGNLVMHAPAGGYTGDSNSELIYQLRAWWKQHRHGRAFDSNTGFYLPDGSMLSPDAAYVAPERLRGLGKDAGAHFLRLCPNFVIELLSTNDRLARTERKMENWIANGAELGWLVDPYRKQVQIHQPGTSPKIETGLSVAGEGPVAGFTLDLSEIWDRYLPDEN